MATTPQNTRPQTRPQAGPAQTGPQAPAPDAPSARVLDEDQRRQLTLAIAGRINPRIPAARRQALVDQAVRGLEAGLQSNPETAFNTIANIVSGKELSAETQSTLGQVGIPKNTLLQKVVASIRNTNEGDAARRQFLVGIIQRIAGPGQYQSPEQRAAAARRQRALRMQAEFWMSASDRKPKKPAKPGLENPYINLAGDSASRMQRPSSAAYRGLPAPRAPFRSDMPPAHTPAPRPDQPALHQAHLNPQQQTGDDVVPQAPGVQDAVFRPAQRPAFRPATLDA